MRKNNNHKKSSSKKLTRKEALKKIGVTALTTSTLLFLETKNAAASSTEPSTPGTGW